MPTHCSHPRPFDILLLGVLASSAGCAVETKPEDTGGSSSPLYAVLSRVTTPEGVTGLLYLVPSLATTEAIDPATAYEMSGGGTLAALEGERALLYLSSTEPTVTRYEVDAAGGLIEDVTLSAALTGAQSLSFVAQTAPDVVWLEAYPTLSLLPLNPLTMELGELVELPEIYRDEFPDAYLGKGVVRDGTMFLPVYPVNFTEGTGQPGTELVAFDVEARSHTIVRDDRCDWGAPMLMGDEIVVAATEVFGASLYLQGAEGFHEPCLLRIPSGSTSFDSAWTKPFSDWTGTAVAGELIPVSEDRAYTRIYDDSLTPADPVYYWDYAYADAWRWGIVDPSGDEPATVIDAAPAFGRVDRHTVNGVTWTFEYTDADDTSRLASLGADGITIGAAFAGFVDGIVALDGGE